MIDPSGQYMSGTEERNIPKGFLGLLLVTTIVCLVLAGIAYGFYAYRAHPEWFYPEQQTEKNQAV